MARRRIEVFYHGGAGNAQIAETDYEQFGKGLQQTFAGKVDVEFFPSTDIISIYEKVDLLIGESTIDELYLHFSGHGNQSGIPYSDMIFENEKFANLLDHYKIRFCFFASCESAELVRLSNERKIPVVIGTLGDNPIGNQFAIQFQKVFYEGLLNSRTFEAAFKKAHDEIEITSQSKFIAQELIRGEGSKLGAGQHLNALQIVFSKKEHKDMYLVSPDFLKEMANPKPERPYLLTWFDDAGLATRFRTKFYAGGFAEQVHYIQIKDEELPLLNKRGDPDPLATENARLLICCKNDDLLKAELKAHCSSETLWKMDHYKVLFAYQQTAHPAIILGDEKLIPEKNRISFDEVEELLADNVFLNQLAEHRIPFSKRREMTLRINPKPLRSEMVVMPKTEMFLRIYFGKNINEHLINFLANYLKDQAPDTSTLVLLDNHQDPQMNYAAELTKEIKRIKGNGNLIANIVSFISDHFILVLRNRHKDIKEWEVEIRQILELLEPAAAIFVGEPPKFPLYIFFLHDTSIATLPAPANFLFAKQFSDPVPIDIPILEEWKTFYSPENFGPIIADEVQTLIKKIPIKDFEKSCPSNVIAYICDELKIPRKQVIGL